MAAYISKKKALIRFVLSFFLGVAVMAFTFQLLKGPHLGPHYDHLLQFVENVPVSGELLLIETRLPQPDLSQSELSQSPGAGDAALQDTLVEPSSLASVLMTMTEMNAGSLIIQTPVSETLPGGAAFPTGLTRDELRSRFDGEFNLVERNIRNLFEAIRLGFILPAETERYVGELVNITQRGKDRLLRALIPADRPDRSPLERASAVFGKVWSSGAVGEQGSPWYYHTQPDRDGKIRRITPSIGLGEMAKEHIVYAALKDRLPAEPEFFLPTDDLGAVLFIPLREGDFRRIPLAAFLEYEEADRELFRLLSNAESQGIYAEINPESYPGYLYEYARNMREELLRDPDSERKARWLGARAKYFQSLDDFFNGPSETRLVDGYERMIASESLGVEGIRRITALRNELILSFRNLRENYAELLEKRAALELELSGSFCILGPPDSELENSAILANTLLTGRAISPGQDQNILYWTLLGLFIILAGIALLGPWISLGVGLLLSAVLGIIFSYSFIFRANWMDPLIPLSAAAAGVLVSFVFALLAKRHSAARLRRAYGSRMAAPYLRRIIRAGRPLPAEILIAKAAIVVIRDGNLNGIENRNKPLESAKASAAFREEVFRIFSSAGAVMTGVEGDLAVFAFGSPLERQVMKKMKTTLPEDGESIRAAELVLDILKNTPSAASWRFAMDTGECSFSWSEAAGYTASGHAVVSARLISHLCPRYKARILVSSRVAEKLGDVPAKNLGAWRPVGALVDQGGEREEFYALGDL